MPRTQGGISISAPGPPGSPSIAILSGKGAPSTQTIDPLHENVTSVQLGSLFIDYQTPALYFKTGMPNTWAQVTIP
jgi:hypothetical protein